MNIVDQVKASTKKNELTLEDLISLGLELRQKRDGINWGLGDIAVEIIDKMGGKKILPQFASQVGVPAKTLKRYANVARSFPDEKLRQEYGILSFSHFKLLAARDDRHEWLVRAVDENLTVERLNVLLNGGSKTIDDGKPVPAKPEMALCMRHRKWYIVYPGDTCPPGCDHKAPVEEQDGN